VLYATGMIIICGVCVVRHGYATYPWRTECTPRVALYQWRGTSGVQQYATARQILYATDKVFPSSV
jgi:hypothetical protein